MSLLTALCVAISVTAQPAQISEKKAAKIFQTNSKKAAKGDARAQCMLGNAYIYGLGVARDSTKAVYWYEKAADQGDAEAQGILGAMYLLGQGVPKDESKSFALLEKAANQGLAEAQVSLALFYLEGVVVEEDEKQGNAAGQLALGMYCLESTDAEDIRKGVYWIEQAAKNGVPRAQLLLSQMYEKGQEVTKDPKKAAYWKKKYEKNPAAKN